MRVRAPRWWPKAVQIGAFLFPGGPPISRSQGLARGISVHSGVTKGLMFFHVSVPGPSIRAREAEIHVPPKNRYVGCRRSGSFGHNFDSFLLFQHVNRQIPSWHWTTCHPIVLWAKLLIFSLYYRLAWEMDQGIRV